MHDAVCTFPRILLLRGWVNKGKKKGRSYYAPALAPLFALFSKSFEVWPVMDRPSASEECNELYRPRAGLFLSSPV
jgi:hypothetical protein